MPNSAHDLHPVPTSSGNYSSVVWPPCSETGLILTGKRKSIKKKLDTTFKDDTLLISVTVAHWAHRLIILLLYDSNSDN